MATRTSRSIIVTPSRDSGGRATRGSVVLRPLSDTTTRTLRTDLLGTAISAIRAGWGNAASLILGRRDANGFGFVIIGRGGSATPIDPHCYVNSRGQVICTLVL